uniref:Ras GTPase-activating-like protein IQGAP3 n=1 Tax=Stegastes partitus TaxID=144197 RepID=A0A3B5AJT8_9TELE
HVGCSEIKGTGPQNPGVLQLGTRLTAEQMDEQRIQNVAYQYLCRLEEAKRWMEACLGEELPAPTELEEALRNGVILAKVGHRFAPNAVPQKKIYDPEQLRYQAVGLQFRHTDNINHWRSAMMTLGLPAIFYPETTDVYDKKNMPRAVYCIHALSLYLYRLGLAPQIHDLYGKVKFTEEEINNMKLELDKYGIQMPAFGKIGGILANELSVDEAAVHAAVVAINKAVDQGDVGVVAAALRNPAALLTNLQEVLMCIYQEMLRQAKRTKAERAAGRQGASEDKDMYEEYLTQKEIQENINTVNIRSAVEQVDEALDAADELSLLSALQLPCLALRGLHTDNGPWYLDQLSADRQQKDQGSVDPLEAFELQDGVTIANQDAQRARNMHAAVQSVNASLRGNDPRHTVSCLMTSELQLPEVFPSAAKLYHRELQLLQRQTGELQQEELFVAVEMLSAVALINQALEMGHLQKFSSSLITPSAGLSDVDHDLLDRYFECLVGVKQQVGRDLLNWNQLQEGINTVNISAQDEHQQLLAVGVINQAVMRGDVQQLLSALLLHTCGVDEVTPANACRYLTLLTRARQHKAQENKKKQTLRVLSLPEVELQGVLPDCATEYQRELNVSVVSGDNRSPWVRVRLQDGSWYYFNLNRLEGSWDRPNGFIHNSVFIDHQEIQEVVRSISASYSRSVLWQSSEALIIRLQALSRGFLIRRQQEARQRYLVSQTPAVVVIQAQWRRYVQQRAYRRRLQFLYMNWRAVVKIQSMVRMWLVKRKYRARLSFFRLHSATPPLSVVKKFVHLLDLGDGDIREEAELLRLREEVVRSIRFNRQLEADLDLMDLKIGLLVRNRATLQEVVSHCKKLTKKNKEQLSDMMDVERSKGLKALNRDRRERLEAYQHLFYLLQTQPLYLAQVIFLMPQSRSNSFMEMLVFSLFNYGSGRREAYLLLQLFTEALRYEIRLKVEQPQDVVTGNPTVIKMLVNFYRHARGQNALREALGPALQDVLLDRTLSIRTDPVDVYKTWINQTETQTGTKSSLPYEVSPEDALSHPEVQRRIDIAIINLKNLTDRVLKAITSNLHKLPYGLRYTAKVLRDTLKAKFPDASEDDLYKVNTPG